MANVNALSQVEAQRFGDRIRKFFAGLISVGGVIGSLPGGINGIIEFVKGLLGNFDVEKIRGFVEAVQKIGLAATSKDQLLAFLDAARLGALITPTTLDDSFVKGINNVASIEMIQNFIVGVIDKLKAAQTAGTMSALSDDELAKGAPVNASFFDVTTWITIAKAIVFIWNLFRAKPAAATP